SMNCFFRAPFPSSFSVFETEYSSDSGLNCTSNSTAGEPLSVRKRASSRRGISGSAISSPHQLQALVGQVKLLDPHFPAPCIERGRAELHGQGAAQTPGQGTISTAIEHVDLCGEPDRVAATTHQ